MRDHATRIGVTIGMVVALLALSAAPLHATPAEAVCFRGTWDESADYGVQRFAFRLRLTGPPDRVEGLLTWRQIEVTFDRAGNGQIARERVRGTRRGDVYDLRGVSVSDPRALALDHYRFTVRGDSLRGSSRTNENDWSSRMVGQRIDCAPR